MSIPTLFNLFYMFNEIKKISIRYEDYRIYVMWIDVYEFLRDTEMWINCAQEEERYHIVSD